MKTIWYDIEGTEKILFYNTNTKEKYTKLCLKIIFAKAKKNLE